jgi:hypothetical protein
MQCSAVHFLLLGMGKCVGYGNLVRVGDCKMQACTCHDFAGRGRARATAKAKARAKARACSMSIGRHDRHVGIWYWQPTSCFGVRKGAAGVLELRSAWRGGVPHVDVPPARVLFGFIPACGSYLAQAVLEDRYCGWAAGGSVGAGGKGREVLESKTWPLQLAACTQHGGTES